MKISKRSLLVFFILTITCLACVRQVDPNAFEITGKIKGAAGLKIYLEELTVNRLNRVDSAIAGLDGSFSFLRFPKESGFYLLKFQNQKFITLNLGKGEKNEIIADTATFPEDYKVTGTLGSELLHDYFTKTAINQQKLDSLSRIFIASQNEDNFFQIKQRLDSSFRMIFSNQQGFLKDLIVGNPSSIASLLLLNQRFANKILLDEAENFDLFIRPDSNLFSKYPENSHVIKHHERVIKIAREKADLAKTEALLSPGNPAPILNLRDVSDKVVSSASLKGKYYLLNFWVSYSPPCRAANLQLKEIYKRYQPEGFEIFAVSFDTSEEFWKNSIATDKLPWINVSDLSGINSPVRKLYNLSENLPYFYLVEKDGKIAAKGFTIAELRKLLQEKQKN